MLSHSGSYNTLLTSNAESQWIIQYGFFSRFICILIRGFSRDEYYSSELIEVLPGFALMHMARCTKE